MIAGGARSALLALALIGVLAAPARADDPPGPDPLAAFLEANPGVRGEDLVVVASGDRVDRVLAVLHNPESGLAAQGVRVVALDGNVQTDRGPEELAGPAGASASETFLVLVTQECDDRQPPPRMRPGGWLLLRANRLAAWDVPVYGPDCRVQGEQVEASDHEAMRQVGEAHFRRLGRGRFRYGTLRYDAWDDAFAAPTREATLSLLRAHAVAAPEDGAAQNRLAVALYAAGERDAALERLRRASRLQARGADAHRNLAAVYRQRGQKDEAAQQEALAGSGAVRPDISGPPAPVD